MANITLSPYTVQLLADGTFKCVFCHRPAFSGLWTCQRCHDWICDDATQGAIKDALTHDKQ